MEILIVSVITMGMLVCYTANLTLNDGSIAYPVLAYNEAGNQAVIKIRRKTK